MDELLKVTTVIVQVVHRFAWFNHRRLAPDATLQFRFEDEVYTLIYRGGIGAKAVEVKKGAGGPLPGICGNGEFHLEKDKFVRNRAALRQTFELLKLAVPYFAAVPPAEKAKGKLGQMVEMLQQQHLEFDARGELISWLDPERTLGGICWEQGLTEEQLLALIGERFFDWPLTIELIAALLSQNPAEDPWWLDVCSRISPGDDDGSFAAHLEVATGGDPEELPIAFPELGKLGVGCHFRPEKVPDGLKNPVFGPIVLFLRSMGEDYEAAVLTLLDKHLSTRQRRYVEAHREKHPRAAVILLLKIFTVWALRQSTTRISVVWAEGLGLEPHECPHGHLDLRCAPGKDVFRDNPVFGPCYTRWGNDFVTELIGETPNDREAPPFYGAFTTIYTDDFTYRGNPASAPNRQELIGSKRKVCRVNLARLGAQIFSHAHWLTGDSFSTAEIERAVVLGALGDEFQSTACASEAGFEHLVYPLLPEEGKTYDVAILLSLPGDDTRYTIVVFGLQRNGREAVIVPPTREPSALVMNIGPTKLPFVTRP